MFSCTFPKGGSLGSRKHVCYLGAQPTCTRRKQATAGLDVQKHNVLFWWGFQSVRPFPVRAAVTAGKALRIYEPAATRRCSWNKRKTGHSVTTSGSQAQAWKCFPFENWRQMELSSLGSLAPSSLLLTCSSKPANPKEKEYKENKLCRRHCPHMKAFLSCPTLLPHWLSCSVN